MDTNKMTNKKTKEEKIESIDLAIRLNCIGILILVGTMIVSFGIKIYSELSKPTQIQQQECQIQQLKCKCEYPNEPTLVETQNKLLCPFVCIDNGYKEGYYSSINKMCVCIKKNDTNA
jgi:hypothetical protein